MDTNMDVEDMIAIAKVQEGDNGGEHEEVTEKPKMGKKEKKGKRSRPRKSQQLEAQEEEAEEQLGADGDHNEHIPELVEAVQNPTNLSLDGAFDEQEHEKKPKKSRKRKRKSGDSDTAFNPAEVGLEEQEEEEVPIPIETKPAEKAKKRKRKSRDADTALEREQNVPEEQVGDEAPMLVETKSAGNKSRRTRLRKSRDTVVEAETREPEETQDAIPEGEAETISAGLADLPKKLEQAKKKAKASLNKSIEVFIPALAEDDNDSAAALHRPLTPAHMGHHRTSSNSHEEAAVQLQKDAQSGSADPEREPETTPQKPSKKALGKRKASDVGVGTSKKRKTQKDQAAGTPELTSFGFTQSSEPQRRGTPMFTPINGPRASILPPSAQRPAVEPEANYDSDEAEHVPEVPNSSERKKKRRLPVGDDEPNPKTPQNKGSQKSKPPKSDAKTPQPRTPATRNGRLSAQEIESIATAVEEYRDQNDLTEYEINALIQKDARTDGSKLWKHMCEEVPDIPRVKLMHYCRRNFHNFEARGVWTEEQDQELREAYEKYPGKWVKIGETLNRFSEDCRDRWRNYAVCGDNLRKDAWDKEEEQRFKDVVQECIEMVREMKRASTDARDKAASDESLVDWKIVSQKMNHTRSRLQCLNKWRKLKEREEVVVDDPVLAKPISETWRIEEGMLVAQRMQPKTKLLLLYAIRESGAGREGTIPWKRLTPEVPGKPRKMAMRIAFRQMRQQIEGNEDMTLQDIIDLLIDAYEASVPSEPSGFDDDFERFRSSQKILQKRKKKSKGGAEAEVESSSNDNGEGPSTISKPKRKARLSEKYVTDNDDEVDDVWAVPRDEQPTKSKRRKTASSLQADESHVDSPPNEQPTKSKRRKTTSSLQADENRIDSSGTKKKRKLRERMKDVGQSQSQSQERDDHRHSELSDVHTALESLKTGNSKARRAAAKEATKSKGKPFLSEERVVESDEEEAPMLEREPPTNGGVEAAEEEYPWNEDQPSENEEEPVANEEPLTNEELSENEEEPPQNEKLSENEDLEVDEQEPLANEEEPSDKEDPVANGDEMDLDKQDANSLGGSEVEEDEMDLDNQDTYTAPGGPEAEDDDSPLEDEEANLEHHDQESLDAEDEEESTKHYDHESVDLDATRDTATNDIHDENEDENQASDAETDFHGFQDAGSYAGSIDLDTPVQTNYRKMASPVTFEEEPPMINGLTNGHRHVEEEQRVSSDDDDMSDIPAKIAPKPKVTGPKYKKEKKSKSKSKKRPMGFR